MDSSPDPVFPVTETPQAHMTEPASDDAHSGSSRGMLAAIFVWALIVLGLLAYLLFGSITARMWNRDVTGQFYVQENAPRRVAHIWWYELQHLPEFAGSMTMKVLFAGSLSVIVIGSAACIWLMLTDVRRGGSQPE